MSIKPLSMSADINRCWRMFLIYSPPKREPPPLTPEQIKAQEKRARRAAKQKEQTNGT